MVKITNRPTLALMFDLRDYLQKSIKFMIIGAIGAGVNLGCLYVFVHYFHIWYIEGEVLATIIAFVANFNGNILVKTIKIDKSPAKTVPNPSPTPSVIKAGNVNDLSGKSTPE